MKSLWSKQKRFAYSLTLPISVVLLGLLIFPLIFSVYISTMSTAAGLHQLQFVGLRNYKEVFTSSIFFNSVKNTVIFVIATVSTTTIVGFSIALLLNDIKRCVGVFRTLLITPLAIAPVVAGLTWGMMFNPLFGVVNYLLGLKN